MGQRSVLAPLLPSVAISRLETWGWHLALGSELPQDPVGTCSFPLLPPSTQ